MSNAFKIPTETDLDPEADRQQPSGLSIVRQSKQRSFLFWIMLSSVFHVLLVGFIALLVTVLAFFGINFDLFDLKIKNRDIEFVLVDNSPKLKPLNPTKNRAERDSRSGGETPKKPSNSLSQRAAGAESNAKESQAQPTPKPQPKSQPKPQQKPSPKPQPKAVKPAPKKPTPKPAKKKPQPPAPRKVVSKRKSPTAAKRPVNPVAPSIKTPAPSNPKITGGGGPIARTPSRSASSGSAGRPSSTPRPSTISGSPSRSSYRGSGGRGAYNQAGAPGGGRGRAGIDAIAEPDFGPYIAELQRRIRRNWTPPVEDRSKRVVAYFVIGRDGRLLSLRIDRSSGSVAADNAALSAVRASAPFRQLPPNFRGRSIPVQFIFDYETTGSGAATRVRR
ncbi:MAG: TonB family protein [Cyanobacteria bacterium P01_H01_bin.74]